MAHYEARSVIWVSIATVVLLVQITCFVAGVIACRMGSDGVGEGLVKASIAMAIPIFILAFMGMA